MTLLRRRRLGIFLMAISVVFLIATVTSLFYYYRPLDQQEYFNLPPNADIPPSDLSRENRAWQEEQERRFQPMVFPYRWLALPLTISGIAFFVLGWLFYHEKSVVDLLYEHVL